MQSQQSIFDQIRNNEHKDEDACHMFFDWFCADSSLERRAKPLMSLLKKIAFSAKFDARASYAFFKNCAPLSGGTYDRFSICDCETRDVQFCVENKGGVWNVFVAHDGFEAPSFTGTARQVADWFNGTVAT